jgi:hypothetical protein
MIDIPNIRHNLSVIERKSILERALNATPFFNIMPFEVVSEATKRTQYKAKTQINLDYFLTDVRTNFDFVTHLTGSIWLMNLYLATSGRSLYGFNKSQPVPSSFVSTDARFDNLVVDQRFDDRQRESIPFSIKRGDEVICEVENVDAKDAGTIANVMLAGFNILKYPYLNSRETELINRSLNVNTVFQSFKVMVNHNGQKYYNFENDSCPRIVLGFGIVNSTSVKTDISESTISILDTTRHLKFSNEPLPVEFLAPRLSCVLDTHIYYLPIEYYFMPFGNLRLQIKNFFPDEDTPSGYELVMLTRTV